MAAASTKNKVFSMADVAKHNTPKSLWLTYNNSVYDLTSFEEDHPGGPELILKYAGKDMGDVMADPEEHVHSRGAYEMLAEYRIGRVGGVEKIVDEDWVPDINFHPEDTDALADYSKNSFLDLNKPLLRQVWEGNFSKEFYLEQVHQPRHVKGSARLFGNDFLEMFTVTPWYVVPMFWGPITMFLAVLSVYQFNDSSITAKSLLQTLSSPTSLLLPTSTSTLPPISFTSIALNWLPSFLLGNVVWIFLEYTLHRFLFHIDYWLPDNGAALTLHFLLHGIHHYLPMDKLRLVMPPLLFFILSFPFTQLAHALFPKAMANGVISGAYLFYIGYDVMHHHLHHVSLPSFLHYMKRYHLAHHYKDPDNGFGVTTPILDYVFGTVLALTGK